MTPPVPESASPPPSHKGALYVNGILWSLLLVGALVLAATWGSYAALIPLLGVFVVASGGLVLNLVLFLLKVAIGRFRQAARYGIGCLLLAVVVLWWWSEFHDIPIH